MWKFDSKISDLEETLWPRKLEVTVVCRETHVYAGKYCWKILKLCDMTGKVSCRTESVSVWNTVLWDIAPSEFSAKSPLEQYHMESPLNPISFNFSSKYSEQELRGCVGVRRGPAVLFPPVSKKKYSKYPVLFLHLPDVLSCHSRGSRETLLDTKSSHRTCFILLLLCFTVAD